VRTWKAVRERIKCIHTYYSMTFLIECPHCNQSIEVIETNCCIFRCGVYKETFQQINPHLEKNMCDELVKKDLIYGCGKPFQLEKIVVNNEIKYNVRVCEYI